MGGPVVTRRVVQRDSRMPVRTEITTGVFDPRSYKLNDVVHWAKRRKSSWLAWPGTIKYTRERTVDGMEETDKKNDDEKIKEKEKKRKECSGKPERDIKINIEKKNVRRAHSVDIWPKRSRTDITELYR